MSRAIENALSRLSASEAARCRLLSSPGEPLFIADWDRALMIHYEVDGVALQRKVPFELDLWNGRAFVSLVAFLAGPDSDYMTGQAIKVDGGLVMGD